MAEQVVNNIIVMEPQSKSVQDLVKLLQAKGDAEILLVTSPDEALQLTQQYQPCVLAVSIHDNNSIPTVVTLLKKIEKSIKSGMTKTFVISKVKNRQMANLITGMGVTDYIEEPIPARTLQFKANLVLRALDTIRKQLAQKNAAAEKIVFKKSSQNSDQAHLPGGEGAQRTKTAPALELQEDTFLFKNSQTKKVGKKFTIEMEGPDPETGDWVPHEDKGDASNSWRWVPKKETADKNPPKPEESEDGWVHSGDKPTFNPETQKWQMTSEKPDLALIKKRQKVAQKIRTNEQGEIEVAADSPFAEENLLKNKEIAKRQKEKKTAAIEKTTTEETGRENKQKSVRNSAPSDTDGEDDESDQSPEAIAKREKKKSKEKNGLDKLAALQEKLNRSLESAPDSEEQSDGDSDGAATAKSEEIEETEDSSPEALAKKEKSKEKKKLSPIDFLKKKKESGGEEESKLKLVEKKKKRVKADGTPEGEDDDGGDEEDSAALAKKRKDRISAKLAQLKSRVGESEDEAGEESPGAIETLKKEKSRDRGDGDGDEDEASPEEATAEEKNEPVPLTPEEEEARAEERKLLAKKKKDKLRKEVFQKIQDEVNKPIEESLPDELEKFLRKKHKLEDRPDVTAKDLARREKADNLKQMKEKLLEIDQMNEDQLLDEEQAPERKVHDLSEDELENTWSQKSFDMKGPRKINAFDSDVSEVEEDGDSKLDKVGKKDKLKKILGQGAEEKYVYMKRDQIQPDGGAWEGTGDYYVYIQGEIHYHGFKVLREILPLWVYGGEAIPILLDKSQEWRFHLSLPKKISDIKDLPEQVREYLLALRDRVKDKNAPVDAEEAAEIETLRRKTKTPKSAHLEEKAARDESETIDEALDTVEKEKKRSNSLTDKLAALNDKLDSEIESSEDKKLTSENESVEESANETDAEKISAEAESSETKKKSLEQEALEVDKEKVSSELEEKQDGDTADATGSTEDNREKKSQEDAEIDARKDEADSANTNGEKSTADERIASLRAAMDKGLDALESSEESSDNSSAKDAVEDPSGDDSTKREHAENDDASESKKDENKDTDQSAESKLKGKSKGISEFFKRRKNKNKNVEASSAEDGRSKPPASPTSAPHEAFLGVFVALSDAVTLGGGREKSCMKVLRAVRAAFDDCELAILAPGTGTVLYSTSDSMPPESVIALPHPHAYALTGNDGGDDKNLGYLYLKIEAPRESFTPSEMAVIKKSASVLWAIVMQEDAAGTAEKAA